jgi:hypothetical protein
MNIEITAATPGYKRPSMLVVAVALPGLVVGAVTLGPSFRVLVGATLVAVWLLLRAAPLLSDLGRKARERPDVVLSAPAVVDHRVVRCDIDHACISWRPRHGERQAMFAIALSEVQGVVIQPQRGPQTSSLTVIRLSNGQERSIRVYCRANKIADALTMFTPL